MVVKRVSQVFPSRVFDCHVGAWFVSVASVYAGSFHNKPLHNWARPLLTLGRGFIKPTSWRSVNLDFYPLQLPPHPMGSSSLSGRTRGVTIKGSGDDSSKACGSTVLVWMPWTVITLDRLSGSHLWRMTRVALPLEFSSDWSVASSSLHFLYKYHTPSPLLSLLSAKTHCQSTSVILVREHSIQFRYLSSKTFFRSLANLVSTLFFTSLSYPRTYSSIFLDFIHLSPLLDLSES